MNQKRQECAEYFYPDNAGWGGYVRLFDPCISGGIGSKLTTDVWNALRLHNKDGIEACNNAIETLSKSHKKVVSHKKGIHPEEVICHPTPEAAVAIDKLREMLAESI